MKKSITLGLLCLLAGIFSATAQISINTDGSAPDSSAMLDIKSTDRGFLPPRLTFEQIIHITNPAKGLSVYCLDCKELLVYNGIDWIDMNGDPIKFEIGAYLLGGKIFYITPDNDAYIIMEDLGTNLKWGCQGMFLNVTESSLGAGETNTSAIIEGCPVPSIAANFCKSLNYNGYSDWFLPSKSELTYAFLNLPNDNWNGGYWSSTELNASTAFKISSAGPTPTSKNTTLNGRVRCVRYTAGPDCMQESVQANAGVDMYNLEDTTTILQGSDPGTANGFWTISAGTGGVISEPTNPNSIFTGLSGGSYRLNWTVTDTCGLSSDEVIISFLCWPQPVSANAGPDQVITNGLSCTLAGNLPATGTGTWLINTGSYGYIASPNNPSSVFYGVKGEDYDLSWKISTRCGSDYDHVMISFSDCSLVTANAGDDIRIEEGPQTDLRANDPLSGTGTWSILTASDGGGIIDEPHNPRSKFIGGLFQSYKLRWTISNICGEYSFDDVNLNFGCGDVASAGGDYEDVCTGCGIPMIGYPSGGIWEMVDGEGGNFDYNSMIFWGLAGHHYTFKYSVYTCKYLWDFKNISYICEITPTSANAGPNQMSLSGTYTTLQGNAPTEGTGKWSVVGNATGAIFDDETNPTSGFTGAPGISYTLRWTITSSCGNFSSDDMYLSFVCTPVTADAGPDQLNLQANSTYLQANTPANGSFQWSIFSGTGGWINSPNDPQSLFTGIAGNSYTLRWTVVTSSCGIPYDDVNISFLCHPQPTQSNAGPDQLNLTTLSTTLQANTPTSGTGQWNIISGTGGVITDINNPTSGFTGVEGQTYDLRWSITACSTSYDDVTISISCPQANAGSDQLNLQSLSTSLQGNSPWIGTANWSILSGNSGVIANPSSPTSGFTGIEGQTYQLQWAFTSSCGSDLDTVIISIACPLPNAGPDQLDVAGTSTTLQGNTPWIGSGTWSILSGTGGNIVSPTNPNSTFTGVPGNNGYWLRWTVSSTNCVAQTDDVHITFECTPLPSASNAGPDQSNIAGVTTTLQGSTPVYGTGTWSVASGANGIIAQPNNPSSTFTGTNGGTYILAWAISNTCGTSVDYVTISFAAFSCGNTFQDTRDGHVYTTLTRGAQCWMKQNLNYATGNSLCYAGNPTNCDNFGRLYDWNNASTACPTNWHLPTDVQWCTLLTGIDGTVSCGATGVTGTNAGGSMKETGTTYWAAPNTGATNSSGFTARGGGSTTIPGRNLTQWGSFWTATTYGSYYWSWEMTYNDARVWHSYYGWTNTMSVRCLKN
jgi:uncharacterized protein (TIGR02145 family)